MVRGTIAEVMQAAPASSVRIPVIEAIEAVRERYDLDEPVIRLTKLGPRLDVEVDVTVGPRVTVGQLHEVRVELERLLAALPFDVWLTSRCCRATPRAPTVGRHPLRSRRQAARTNA